MEEKLKTKLSAETIDLVYHMIDWLYFADGKHYNSFPYSKDELYNAMNGMRCKKVSAALHKRIKARQTTSKNV